MASKLRMLKLLLETQGFPEIANRCPPSRETGLPLGQVRPPLIQVPMLRRSLKVIMVEPDGPDISHPVRINHVKQTPRTAATHPAS
jgi:hypothetical protein